MTAQVNLEGYLTYCYNLPSVSVMSLATKMYDACPAQVYMVMQFNMGLTLISPAGNNATPPPPRILSTAIWIV